ncbi:MAG: MFS transporter, partial [Dehalococcoidia bacterium]|nr:MFS transporter [Dehalococcoidia bacterium]
SAAVSNWFQKRRGTAIGVMSAGIGAGGLVLSPLVGHLILALGWRTSYLLLAVIVWLAIIPASLLVLRTKPAEKGLYPDGAEAPEAVNPAGPLPSASNDFTLRMALTTSAFWLIGVSLLVSNFSNMGVIQSQVPHLDDIGFPVGTAAAALGAVGLGSAIGKIFFGWLCDRIQPKYACAIGMLVQLAAAILLLSIRPTWPLATIWLYALTLGFSAGSWLPTMSMLVSTSFGLTCYGAIFGTVHFIQNLGTGTGPLIAGYLYDSMNTYHWAFVIFVALYAIAIPAVLLVRHPVRRP